MTRRDSLLLRRAGLTLVEMIAVLAVMAILTGVAMQMTTQRLDQARHEATSNLFQQVQTAVVGSEMPSSTGNSTVAPSFVSDLGRLPESVIELVTLGNATPLFELKNNGNFAGATITLPRGWRGPYLSLPVGTLVEQVVQAGTLLDGWGNPIEQLYATEGHWQGLRSFGMDNAIGAAGLGIYDRDEILLFARTQEEYVELLAQAATTSPTDAHTTVVPPPTPALLTIELHAPGLGQFPAEATPLAVYLLDPRNIDTAVPGAGGLAHSIPAGASESTIVVPNMPTGFVGTRVLLITQTGMSSGEQVKALRYLNVRAGETIHLTLSIEATVETPEAEPPTD